MPKKILVKKLHFLSVILYIKLVLNLCVSFSYLLKCKFHIKHQAIIDNIHEVKVVKRNLMLHTFKLVIIGVNKVCIVQ